MALPAQSDKLKFTNLEELEKLVTPPVLSDKVFGYYRSGAESEATVKENRQAFGRVKLMPRMLVDVSKRDMSTELMGKKMSFPVLVAPMAMQRMAHPDGELAVARAAAAAGLPMVQSTMATVRLDEVRQAGKDAPFMMFQLYVIKDREFTKRLIQEAEKAGYAALVVTVDAPRLGNREADIKNSFSLPEGMQLENLMDLTKGRKSEGSGSQIAATFISHIDPSLTWEFVNWVRTVTKLPIWVKGILSPRDAQQAVDVGVDGVIVSNHGGRQVDFSPAAFDMLPAVVRAIGGRTPILVDGGVRRGTDIVKALALGADGVLLGRPVLYGLALGGQAGVERVLSILQREFGISMALMGCPTVRHLSRSMVLLEGDPISML